MIEGLKVVLSAGEYATSEDGKHSYLRSDFEQQAEITFTIPFDFDADTLAELLEAVKGLYSNVARDVGLAQFYQLSEGL